MEDENHEPAGSVSPGRFFCVARCNGVALPPFSWQTDDADFGYEARMIM